MADVPSRTYRQPRERVFEAALRSVQAAGHQLENIDEESGLLAFTTDPGGFEKLMTGARGHRITLLIRPDASGKTRVEATGRSRNEMQWWSDDSKDELIGSLFDKMDGDLAGAE